MPQESGNLALLDTLMEFARPKDTAKSPMENLHEKIKKLTPETGKHLIEKSPIIREVIRRYVEDKEFAPLHEELVRLGKEGLFWDAEYYADQPAAEPEAKVPRAPQKEQAKKKTGMRRKPSRRNPKPYLKNKLEPDKQEGNKKEGKKADAKGDKGAKDSTKKAGKGKESGDKKGDKPKQEAAKPAKP